MGDKFTDLTSLKQQVPRSAFRVLCLDRKSPVTVMSVHGGFIEPGTSELARFVAGRTYNYFDFQCLRADMAKDMHVTSTRFRDEGLTALLDRSVIAVSIHGMGNQKQPAIWLGGINHRLKEIVYNVLFGKGFPISLEAPLYKGEHPGNVVNLPRENGVQLEISDEFLQQLFCGPAFHPVRRQVVTTGRFRELGLCLRLAIRLYFLHRCDD